MRFDESQAKGLKNHLIRELHYKYSDALDTMSKNIENINVVPGSINALNKAAHEINVMLSEFSVFQYSGFTDNKKYYLFSTIRSTNKREYNTWEEKCLFSENLLLSQKTFEHLRGSYNISEHTLTRIFQRKEFPEDFSAQRDIFLALNELKYLPAFAAYWNRFAINYTNNLGIKKFDVIIPAPSGVFIAEKNDFKYPMLEVRTFLSIEMLNEKQKEIRNIYIAAINNLINTPLPFFILLEAFTNDTVELEARILSGRLIHSFESIFNEMISEKDATLGFNWTLTQLKETMSADAFIDKKILAQLPMHPLKRDLISRKLKLDSYINSKVSNGITSFDKDLSKKFF